MENMCRLIVFFRTQRVLIKPLQRPDQRVNLRFTHFKERNDDRINAPFFLANNFESFKQGFKKYKALLISQGSLSLGQHEQSGALGTRGPSDGRSRLPGQAPVKAI